MNFKKRMSCTRVSLLYDVEKSEDELNLLANGQLRHIIHHEHISADTIKEDPVFSTFSLHDNIAIPDFNLPFSFLHMQNKYCIDKVLITHTNITGLYALVCIPQIQN